MADMTPKQAADEIRKGIRLFKAMEKAEDVLIVLEKQEQLAKELEVRIVKARDERKAAEDDLKDAQAAVEKAKTDAADVLDGARQKAVQIEQKAREQAGQIVDSAAEAANKRAEGIVAAATKEAVGIVDEAMDKAKSLQEESDKLKGDIERMKQDVVQRFG